MRLNNRPYARDWTRINNDLEFSSTLQLYYYKGRVYDQLSASHNGIVGAGAQLKDLIKRI